MENINEKIVIRKKLSVVFPVFLICLNIFLFGPFIIYYGNINEFIVPFLSILKLYIIPFSIITLGLIAVGLLLTKKWHQRYVALLFTLAVLIWLQGNILVWDYGVVGKVTIDWTKIAWRGWIDGLVWVSVAVIG